LDVTTIDHKEITRLFYASVQEFNSVIGTDDPDLSGFRVAGGKMITWQGLADEVITPYGTSAYYEEVEKLDRDVRSFYRYFEAPGVKHCFNGGSGAAPTDALDALVQWVEKGRAPDVLKASTLPADGKVRSRDLCLYPLVSVYLGKGKDPASAKSYECRSRY
jgi:feruloyl esterase